MRSETRPQIGPLDRVISLHGSGVGPAIRNFARGESTGRRDPSLLDVYPLNQKIVSDGCANAPVYVATHDKLLAATEQLRNLYAKTDAIGEASVGAIDRMSAASAKKDLLQRDGYRIDGMRHQAAVASSPAYAALVAGAKVSVPTAFGRALQPRMSDRSDPMRAWSPDKISDAIAAEMAQTNVVRALVAKLNAIEKNPGPTAGQRRRQENHKRQVEKQARTERHQLELASAGAPRVTTIRQSRSETPHYHDRGSGLLPFVAGAIVGEVAATAMATGESFFGVAERQAGEVLDGVGKMLGGGD